MSESQKMKAPYLYKYRGLNSYSEQILSQNEIYIPSPSEFNDPFDCKISVNIKGSDDFYENELQQFLQGTRPDLDGSQISQITEFVMQTGVQRNPELMKQAADLFLRTISQSVGVFCLTAKNDDILMWSHYANSHKGFCLKFRSDSHFRNVKEVKYQKDYPSLIYSGQQDFEWVNSLF